jgi:transcription initiation factor TFIIE subunit alpha
MGMNTKELHKLCGRLKEARFLAVYGSSLARPDQLTNKFRRHTRPELKEGQSRPMNRTYYFIDYRAAIDAIKYRVYKIDKEVQGNTVSESDKSEYFCPRCKSEYTALDVLDSFDYSLLGAFVCKKCQFPLSPVTGENHGGHEQSTKMSQQFKFITDLLPKIDAVVVPENNFEQAYAKRIPVPRDSSNPASETAPLDAAIERPTAVKGMTNVGPTSIAVTLTASEGPTAADIAAEKDRKLKNAAQNALPVHFTHSTISGEQVKFDPNTGASAFISTDEKKGAFLNSPSAKDDTAEIDDYFARLKAEQAKEAEEEQEEEYETDDEEEDEFEDVAGTGSGVGTPLSSFGGESKAAPALGGSGLASALKRSGSVSGSGTSTGVASPVTGPNTPIDDGRPPKKVRIEEPAPKDEPDPESEEDMEFEDV